MAEEALKKLCEENSCPIRNIEELLERDIKEYQPIIGKLMLKSQ